jgi:uncharacterized damage-inducible protein DinB
MNADHFRQLYAYYFYVNRKLWNDSISTLSDEKFKQPFVYSIGSVHNHVVHLMSVEANWFSGLRGIEPPGFLNPQDYPSQHAVREKWDSVEHDIQAYLNTLTDDTVAEIFPSPRLAKPMVKWEVLFHVINHGTDHRSQLLALLYQLGAPTFGQDYVYFTMGQM